MEEENLMSLNTASLDLRENQLPLHVSGVVNYSDEPPSIVDIHTTNLPTIQNRAPNKIILPSIQLEGLLDF
jgi:hypothetical protein